MNTLATSAYLEAVVGSTCDLRWEGSSLENPHVFDAAAREIKDLAARGLVEIVDEKTVGDDRTPLTAAIRFKRLR